MSTDINMLHNAITVKVSTRRCGKTYTELMTSIKALIVLKEPKKMVIYHISANWGHLLLTLKQVCNDLSVNIYQDEKEKRCVINGNIFVEFQSYNPLTIVGRNEDISYMDHFDRDSDLVPFTPTNAFQCFPFQQETKLSYFAPTWEVKPPDHHEP